MRLTPTKKEDFSPTTRCQTVRNPPRYDTNHLAGKMTDKIRLGFELCNETKEFVEGESEKSFSISREFTYSFGAKGDLRPFIDGTPKMVDGEHPNTPHLIDINSTPWNQINALPEFILKKIYSSEEFSNRKRADEMLGEKKVKKLPARGCGRAYIEYPQAKSIRTMCPSKIKQN
jgi:hypothetical protein